MTLSDYLVELEATKARKEKLISFEPYTFKWPVIGMRMPRDNYPRADKEYHILVIDFHRNRPALSCVLTDKKPELDRKPSKSDSNRILFVYVKMKPQSLKIDSPQGGYRLEDGHHINASLDVTYRISNAETFWMESDDSLLEFEKMIVNQAKNYFLVKKSIDLVRNPVDFKKMLEQQRFDEEIEGMKEYFENRMLEKVGINGIKLIRVYAHIELSNELASYLKKQHEFLYGTEIGLLTTITNNRLTDQAIENDRTYSPYNLMDIVNFLGFRSNFYNLPWNSAMQKVDEELTKRRISDKDAEVKHLLNKISNAQNAGIGEHEIEIIKNKLADKLSEDDSMDGYHCNMQYLSEKMPLYLAAKQIAQESCKLVHTYKKLTE